MWDRTTAHEKEPLVTTMTSPQSHAPMGTARRMFTLGAGFLADAYDLFVINLVLRLLKEDPAGAGLNGTAIGTAALAGGVIGQIGFGFLADRIGRKGLSVVTAVLAVSGSLGSALVGPTWLVPGLLAWRLVLGLGFGGEYPLSASISSETAARHERGSATLSVFAMQGVGMLLCPLVILTILAFGASSTLTWRLGLGVGAVPTLIAIYFRMNMHETPKFTAAAQAADADSANQPRLIDQRWKLFGTAMSWFLIDFTFYANGIFHASFIELMGFADSVVDDSKLALLIALMALPGYFLSVSLIDGINRKHLQLSGFIALSVLYTLLAIYFDAMKSAKVLFGLVYGMSFLFTNFGPNCTTFVIPTEIFPTKLRATCHGISAASGKFGALLGAVLLGVASQKLGVQFVFSICALVSIAGVFCTLVFTPSYDQTSVEFFEDGDGVALPLTVARVDSDKDLLRNGLTV